MRRTVTSPIPLPGNSAPQASLPWWPPAAPPGYLYLPIPGTYLLLLSKKPIFFGRYQMDRRFEEELRDNLPGIRKVS